MIIFVRKFMKNVNFRTILSARDTRTAYFLKKKLKKFVKNY